MRYVIPCLPGLIVLIMGCASDTTGPADQNIRFGHDAGQQKPDTAQQDLVVPDSPQAPSQASSAVSLTAGGGTLQSEHYRLHLFVAPAKPVSSGTSENYRVILGPAGSLSLNGGVP